LRRSSASSPQRNEENAATTINAEKCRGMASAMAKT
jgi:hypothetical protein